MSYPIYSSKEVKISWAGYDIQGLADGTFVSFEFNSDVFTPRVGADGKISKSLSPDKTATLTLTLLQESPSNAPLSWALASAKNGTVIQGAMAITDPSGSTLAFLRGASIISGPTTELGIEAGNKEWTFHVEELDFISAPDNLAEKLSDADAAKITAAIGTLSGKIIN